MGNSAYFDGNYDKGSMLDPLVLAFRWSDSIVQPITLRNRFDI